MQRKTIIKSAAILTFASLMTRVIGFFYRIFMSNILGSEGIGLYQLILPVYTLCWSITSSGFTTTISKLTAQEKAKGQYGNMGRVLKQSVFICVFISIILGGLIFLFADYIAINIIKEPRTSLSLKVLSVCFPFMSAGNQIIILAY